MKYVQVATFRKGVKSIFVGPFEDHSKLDAELYAAYETGTVVAWNERPRDPFISVRVRVVSPFKARALGMRTSVSRIPKDIYEFFELRDA